MEKYKNKYNKYKNKYINLKNDINYASNYYIFAGETYYPSGGWKDLYLTTDTLEKAK